MKNISFVLIFLIGCTTAKQVKPVVTPPRQQITASSTVVDGKIFTSVYQQTAAEYKALCFQAFNLATLRLDQSLKNKNEKPRAIITDIDETILDNSAYAIHRGLQGKDYENQSWSEWIARSEADTVPGAASFLKYAASQKVEIFYITNRDEKDRNGTMKNLEVFNLPVADERHLIMRQGSSSKEKRREEITGGYEVVLFLGDNLADFSSLFDKKLLEERDVTVKKIANEFGNKFIILPNPVYGDWEAALYGNNNNYSTSQKDSIIKASGKSY
jgi:5'-nucleotidase (lipoprotein e(P4) family)